MAEQKNIAFPRALPGAVVLSPFRAIAWGVTLQRARFALIRKRVGSSDREVLKASNEFASNDTTVR